MAVRAMRMQQLHRSPSVGPGRKRASASAHERARGSLAVDRRAALAAGALVLGGGALPRAARAEQQQFVEESMGFALTLPDGWEAGVGEISGDDFTPTRRAAGFYPTAYDGNDVNDFTSLGSFGDDFTWGFNIVNETDRSWKDPNDVAAELIDTKKLGDKYFVEYSVKLPGVYDRRLYSIAAIGNIPDKYNLLYTLSATVPTAMMDEYSDTVLEIIKSFKCTHPGVLVPV